MRMVLTLLMFLFDFITFPVYLLIHTIKNISKKKIPAVRLEQTKNDDECVGFKQSLNSSNKRYSEIMVQAGIDTVHKAWKYSSKKYHDNLCFGTREVFREEEEKQPNGKVFKKLSLGEYTWTSYTQAWKQSQNFGKGLRSLGIRSGDKIVIYAETRQEWIISALGAFSQNVTVCTMYTNLGLDAVTHGINETEVKLVITSYDLLNNVRRMLPDCKRLENIIYFKAQIFKADVPKEASVNTISFENVIALGQEYKSDDHIEPGPDDIAIIMYTSGSTGVPKGVMLTHSNIISCVAGLFHAIDLQTWDVYLAYLPLAHIFELLSECTMLMIGAPIGFSSPHTINDQATKIRRGAKGDVSLLHPTVICAVPLMLDRMYKHIKDAVKKKGKNFQLLFDFAFDYKLYWSRQGYETPILDMFMFNKIKAVMGGRTRIMICGGAPLAPQTHEFVRTALGITLLQGYSMTETCCSGTITEIGDLKPGTVGKPFAGIEIRLVNWEEGNYRVTDKPRKRGEILVGGKAISKGYFKNPEKTKDDYFEENGVRFIRTGDIGEICEDGNLKIIDRKKDLVKLQLGEYVSLGKVESHLKNHSLVGNICVIGDSFQTYTVAIISPDRFQLERLGQELGVQTNSYEELCQNLIVRQRVAKVVGEHGKASGLEKFEIPLKVYICPEQWLPDSGLVTAAFKNRRKQIQNRFQYEIDNMYQE